MRPEVSPGPIARPGVLVGRRGSPAVRPSVYTAPKRHLPDRLTADRVELLLADYRAGVLHRDLAEQYGISISSLARLVRQHGLRRRRHRDSTS